MAKIVYELYLGRCSLGYSCAGGAAYIIRFWDVQDGTDTPLPKEVEGSQGFRSTMNVRMDIMSAIYGLRCINEIANSKKNRAVGQINLYGVTEYFNKIVCNGWLDKWQANNWMTSGYKKSPPKPIANRDLWEQFLDIKEELRKIGLPSNLLFHVDDLKYRSKWIFKVNDLALEAAKSTDLIADEKWEVLCKNSENRR